MPLALALQCVHTGRKTNFTPPFFFLFFLSTETVDCSSKESGDDNKRRKAQGILGRDRWGLGEREVR